MPKEPEIEGEGGGRINGNSSMWEVTREGINIVSPRSLLLLRILLERDLFPPYRLPPSLGQIAAAEEEEVQLAWGGKVGAFFPRFIAHRNPNCLLLLLPPLFPETSACIWREWDKLLPPPLA